MYYYYYIEVYTRYFQKCRYDKVPWFKLEHKWEWEDKHLKNRGQHRTHESRVCFIAVDEYAIVYKRIWF